MTKRVMPAQEEPDNYDGSMQAEPEIRTPVCEDHHGSGTDRNVRIDEAGYKTATRFNYCSQQKLQFGFQYTRLPEQAKSTQFFLSVLSRLAVTAPRLVFFLDDPVTQITGPLNR